MFWKHWMSGSCQPVEVTHCGSKKHAGGVDSGFRQQLKAGTDRKKFSADRACPRVSFARVYQHADETREQQNVGIEGQNPF